MMNLCTASELEFVFNIGNNVEELKPSASAKRESMEEDGISFCMLSFYEKEKHIMYLSNLNIAENFREEGRGNDILKFAIDRAKSYGCEYLYLFTVDKDSWITEWYKRKGYCFRCCA